MVSESAESYVERTNQLSEEVKRSKYYTFTALQHIHVRAVQQFLEIITLMKNGFADGAYARWRSMYELTVVASFILKYGEQVAEAFVKAADKDDRNEWARDSGIFPSSKKYISFNDIQKACDLNTKDWSVQYELANKIIHASSQGTFARLSNMKTIDSLPAGRSDYGITTPGEHSAISLSQITTMFFSIFPDGDSIIATKYIMDWIHVIREMYFETHDEMFPDDEPLLNDSLNIE